MAKSMIQSVNMGNSPGAKGESLREFRGTTKESVAVLRYKQTDLSGAGGGCTRGVATPGKQFRTSPRLATLEDRAEKLPPLDDSSKTGIRQYIYEREREAHRFWEACQTKDCCFCFEYLERYHRLIASFKSEQGEWLAYRLECENRTIVKATRNMPSLAKIGIGYCRVRLFINRIHLVPMLDLIGTKIELLKVISVVSELDWRP